jgi:hypothetical protein
MAVYNQYLVLQPTALAAAPETIRVGLGVQPLSALIIRTSANLVTANSDDSLLDFFSKLDNVEVDFRGVRLMSGRAIDLIRVMRNTARIKPRIINPGVTAGSTREVVWVICFGRGILDNTWLLPAVNKGDLTLTFRTIADPARYNNYRISVEAIEIPDARPSEFLRVTTQTFTPSTTGVFDIDLPRVLKLFGIGIVNAQSTPFAGANTIQDVELLVNNAEQYVSFASFESLRALGTLLSGAPFDLYLHRHTENTAAAYTQNAATLTDRVVHSLNDDFGFIHFDPRGDGAFLLDTANLNNLVLRVTVGAVGMARILPVEVGTEQWLFRRPPVITR